MIEIEKGLNGLNGLIEKRRAKTDLLIIVAVTSVVFGIFISIQDIVENFAINKDIHVLLRTLVMALIQFGTAGLGISLVAIIRRESLLNHGLHKKNTLLSIIFSTLAFLPYIIFNLTNGQIDGYLPFQSVWMVQDLLESSIAVGAAGYIIIAIAWGFFEGFNYVVISDKINKLLPVRNRWLNWGAIISGIICLLIHGMIGVTMEGIIEMLTVFLIIYGMLVTRTVTDNAWGCIFIFLFLWNAI